MLTYAERVLYLLSRYAVCWRMLSNTDVCWRILTYADVCRFYFCSALYIPSRCIYIYVYSIYIYVCMYYIYIYEICLHTYLHTYIHTYIHICFHTSTYKYKFAVPHRLLSLLIYAELAVTARASPLGAAYTTEHTA
jgi:hypothetical protein